MSSRKAVVGAVTPVPTDEEAAAIVAAVDALWPRPNDDKPEVRPSTAWRFSGRWWHQDRLR